MDVPHLLFFHMALLLATATAAQEAQAFARTDVPPLTAEITVLHIERDGGVQPVLPEHRFPEGDLVAFELTSSRGGYASLAVAGGDTEEELRVLWPVPSEPENEDRPTGYPIAARRSTRLPPADVSALRLTGNSPTELVVLFSPQPPTQAPRRKWLKQIDLREIELADPPDARPRRLRYNGQVAPGETVKMKIVLHHGEASDE